MKFVVGDTHRAKLQAGQPYKIHVLAILDDRYIAYKFYGRNKQRWHYDVTLDVYLERQINSAKQNILLTR